MGSGMVSCWDAAGVISIEYDGQTIMERDGAGNLVIYSDLTIGEVNDDPLANI